MWGTAPIYMREGANSGFYQLDHLDTPQKIVAAAGNVLWAAVGFGPWHVGRYGYTGKTWNANFEKGQYVEQSGFFGGLKPGTKGWAFGGGFGGSFGGGYEWGD